MKRILLLLILLLSLLNANAQGEIMYKCKDIVQRDSVANSLKAKGYLKFECENTGMYVCLKSDKMYCYKVSLGDNTNLSKKEFYANIDDIKENKTNVDDAKENIKTLNDYLSSIDKFTGEKTYYGGVSTLSFMKVTGKGKSSQYVSIDVNGSTLNYGCYGVSILFKNGKKIIRSKEKVDTDYNDGGWRYKAFFTPTLNEITLLKTQKISAVKLYIYDVELNENDSNTILEAAKIILTTPQKK